MRKNTKISTMYSTFFVSAGRDMRKTNKICNNFSIYMNRLKETNGFII